MKKPEELTELLSALTKEDERSSVVATPESHAVVYTGKNELHLTAEECQLLFHDDATVRRFAETLPGSRKANLELHELVLGDDAQSALETHFSTVDDI